MKKVASALKYDKKENRAPMLIAKGMGIVADNIIREAVEADVPVYEDPMLSQQLYNLDLGDEIPEELYQIVAEVLLFIAHVDAKK